MESHAAVVPWTEEQWDRVIRTVTEEAQRTRLAAQFLPLAGAVDPAARAIAPLTLATTPNPPGNQPPASRMEVDSDPFLPLTTIQTQVQLRSHEIADPELGAALTMFRRAANHIARVEDALIFNGRSGGPNRMPPFGIGAAAQAVVEVTGADPPGLPRIEGLMPVGPAIPAAYAAGGAGRIARQIQAPLSEVNLVRAIMDGIADLDGAGQPGPYALVLSHLLFERVVTPTQSMVMPRDRVLPFLGGPLHRSTAIAGYWGVLIALNPAVVELVVASDINVTFLLTTPEPRYVFRVAEKVALRLKDGQGIVVLHSDHE
jgi:uncharacterized linocin/CFP29 family protein